MTLFSKSPFLVFLLPVVAGIVWGDDLSFLTQEACFVIVGGCIVGMLLSFRRRRLWWLLSIFAGVLLFTAALLRSRSPLTEIVPGEVYRVEGECTEVLRGKRYIIRLQEYNLYLQTHDTVVPFVVGDRLSFSARLFPLKRSVDVHEFDYDRYLRQLDVDLRAVPTTGIERSGHVHTFYSLCQEARTSLTRKLTRVVRDTATRALLQALCLGDRSGISPRVQELFSESGTVHLLAVSGLHMGAIYLLLSYFLKILRVPKRTRAGCVFPLLWLFAGITGLSPSAVRAATILSFVIIGQLLDRDYRAINAVCASAFITLLIAPHLLYSVSFQMSYAAYTGIVLILPLMRVSLKNSFIAKVYSLFSLSLAAQIGTLPLIAYYFHTINLNSVMINIVVVPIASCLLYVGVVCLALPGALVSLLSFVPVAIHYSILFLLEQYQRISANWYELYPTTMHLLFFYAIVLLGIAYLNKRKILVLRAICVTLFLFLLYHGTMMYRGQHRQEVVVYDRYRRGEVLLNYRGYYTFLVRSDTTAPVPPYAAANHLKALPDNAGFIARDIRVEENRLITPRLTLYVADEQYRIPGNADIVVVTGNLYPNRLQGGVVPSVRVIVDRSNSFTCIRRWEEWGARQGIPIEKTGESGPIIIPLEK
ncbi:MAG: ComEC family competence protein [Odoribacteraceae bacterium]|jgi:competence protein ComEC|nr:ComEC family competence protein [Odoribacteraceae bacterium]